MSNNYSDKSLRVGKKYQKKATFEFINKAIFSMIPTAQKRLKWLRKKGKFALLGEHVHYQPKKYPSDNLRVKIHDNVAIAADVEFIPHDIIHWVFDGMAGKREYVQYYGCVEIHENTFIGAGARILPNVSIGPNAIVAAGAVVTSDVLPGTVVGGVPAKVIGSFDDVMRKRKEFSMAHPKGVSVEEGWEEFYASRKGE